MSGPTVSERFFAKVKKTDTCWLWTASLCTPGYGQFRFNGRIVMAHRVSYEMARGPIPAGLVIDHLCRVPRCVNPAHLEPVTVRENTLRGESPAAKSARTDRCGRGHEYTPENTYLRPGPGGYRQCRTCHASARARRMRSRALAE